MKFNYVQLTILWKKNQKIVKYYFKLFFYYYKESSLNNTLNNIERKEIDYKYEIDYNELSFIKEIGKGKE